MKWEIEIESDERCGYSLNVHRDKELVLVGRPGRLIDVLVMMESVMCRAEADASGLESQYQQPPQNGLPN